MPEHLTTENALEMADRMVRVGSLSVAAQLCSKVLEQVPEQPKALYLLAMIALRGGNRDHATELLRRTTQADPRQAPAWNDLGNLLSLQGRLGEAESSYRQAIAAAPAFAEAHNNLGNLFQLAGSYDKAVACYQSALAVRPEYAEAHRNLASALRQLGRPDEAAQALRKALALNPRFTAAAHQLVHLLQELCDWDQLEPLTAELIRVVESQAGVVNPFVFLTLDTTPKQQLICARQWAAAHLAQVAPTARRPAFQAKERITIGYLSGDFHEHATMHLMAELFGLHDRRRFRVIAYSYGPDDGSAARRRAMASCDAFVDLATKSHAESAAQIRSDGVDILVDLKGYTAGARPEILCFRPAPIQVSYLGYPGTLGSEVVDFVIVDATVVPKEEQDCFSEHLVHLPGCYQVNDRHRAVAATTPTRSEHGLPEDGFVFCCLVATRKITPSIFDVWMRLLASVPGSVLWLCGSNPPAEANLRREAEKRLAGAAARLVFAPTVRGPDHIARFQRANLFLDTLPYNAHTVASDALWGGCPVVTCLGKSFPGRVAASLLRAVGLPDLVTHSLEDYEARALELAQNPDHLQAIRDRLEANRLTTVLFDSQRFTGRLETAFETMTTMLTSGAGLHPFEVADRG